MRCPSRVLPLAISLFVTAGWALTATAQYDYFVLDSHLAPPGPGALPTINDAGKVVYAYRHDFGGNDLETNVEGGSHSILYEGNFTPIGSFAVPVINSSDRVAFVAIISTGLGVFSGDGGAITTIADRTGPLNSFDNGVDINDSDTVVFYALTDTTFDQQILTGNGGAHTLIADNTGVFSQLGVDPTISNAGTVVFWADTSQTGTSETGLYTGSGGAVTTLYDESGIFANLFGAPDINNSGEVGFKAQLDTGPTGLFRGNGGTPTAIVDDSGPYLGFSEFAMNDNGDFVFLATLDATGVGSVGLYTGPDPGADKVAAEGDILGGVEIVQIVFFRGFNNNRDVVWGGFVDNGGTIESRVYLARPLATAVPSLGGVGFAALASVLGATAWLGLRRGRR